jgi:diaminohydroxyphosphoribosylaminopyrimidine deaminase / 5-amino-6-(5-phosphoribosylamino)uracil reductase
LTNPKNSRFLAAALALAGRGRARTVPNPNVGCVLVQGERVVGRGWTQPSGRPHAEAEALAQAGDAACGATAYVTLEPCVHDSERGPCCTGQLIAAGVARVVVAMTDPDPRTTGQGIAALRSAGIAVDADMAVAEARASMAGWLMQRERGRPFVTLKLATSLDGCIAMADGTSQWITGDAARAHAHGERARQNAILVGRGTLEADTPSLTVRLPGLEDRSPRRMVLTSGTAPEGWEAIASPDAITTLADVQYLMVEGGAQTASSFLRAGLVDRIYRAPILIGSGKPCLGDFGLASLVDGHGQWRLTDSRMLGSDRLEVYDRNQEAH